MNLDSGLRLLQRGLAWGAVTGAAVVVLVLAAAQVLDEEGIRTWEELGGATLFLWLGAAVGLFHGALGAGGVALGLQVSRDRTDVMLPTLLGVLAVATPLSFLVMVLTLSPLGLAYGLVVGLVAALPILVVVRAERRRTDRAATVSR